MDKLVSVIMGVYNGQETLAQCIESVLKQTYKNWELIICDDCSTDHSYEIAADYAKDYPNIKLVRNPQNMRLAYSLNHCLENAEGEYIARLDADDECEPKRFEKEVAFLNEHPEFAVVGTARYIFDENGVYSIRYSKECPGRPETWSTTPFSHPTIMMRKEVYDQLGGYTVSADTVRAEDLDLWFRFFRNGYKGYNLQEPLYKYRESIKDYNKRTVGAAIHTAKLRRQWHRKLKISRKYDYLWIKPVISSLLPAKMMYYYHLRSDR